MHYIQTLWIAFLLLIVLVAPVFAGDSFVISEHTLRGAEDQYGSSARKRLLAWQDFMRVPDENDLQKLERVNRFFNRIPFVSDTAHWGKEDYWASPTEFLASNGGDCEDFAIAKYFTLIALGVTEQRLALTYVTALRLNQSHMVLTYYPETGLEPLVLDSLVDAIEPSSRRTDLLPIYSFDASGLWTAKQRGKGDRIGDAQRVKPWRELLARVMEEIHQK